MEGIKNILHDDNFKSAEFELQPYIDNLSKKKKKYTWHFLDYIVKYSLLALRKKTWCLWNAQIAQLVEQRTENPRVAGSIPALGIVRVLFNGRTLAFQARYVGSIPITRFTEEIL